MIHLDDTLLVGRGTLRACYRYPDNDALVVKVPLQDSSAGEDANDKEMKSYRALRRKHAVLAHISHCHGLVATDRGQGLVCDCIRDHDGAVSKTIWDIVVHQEQCDLEALLETAGGLCDYLLDNDMFLFDINLKNIAMQARADATWQAWAIDLKGPYDNKEFLQLSSRIPFLGRRKLRRRTRQLLERIVLCRERRASLQDRF